MCISPLLRHQRTWHFDNLNTERLTWVVGLSAISVIAVTWVHRLLLHGIPQTDKWLTVSLYLLSLARARMLDFCSASPRRSWSIRFGENSTLSASTVNLTAGTLSV